MFAERNFEAGFTLVEVLVALVMTALLLAILSDGVSTALRRDHGATERQEAVLVARTAIAEAAAAAYSPGVKSDQANDLRWTVEQSPVEISPNTLYGLIAIRVDVRDLRGRQIFSAATRRVKAMPQS